MKTATLALVPAHDSQQQVRFPRPKTDSHYRETSVSDPVFAVWGTVKSTKLA